MEQDLDLNKELESGRAGKNQCDSEGVVHPLRESRCEGSDRRSSRDGPWISRIERGAWRPYRIPAPGPSIGPFSHSIPFRQPLSEVSELCCSSKGCGLSFSTRHGVYGRWWNMLICESGRQSNESDAKSKQGVSIWVGLVGTRNDQKKWGCFTGHLARSLCP